LQRCRAFGSKQRNQQGFDLAGIRRFGKNQYPAAIFVICAIQNPSLF
jgi:hypothetical protein